MHCRPAGGAAAALKAAYVAHMMEGRVTVGGMRVVLRDLIKTATKAIKVRPQYHRS